MGGNTSTGLGFIHCDSGQNTSGSGDISTGLGFIHCNAGQNTSGSGDNSTGTGNFLRDASGEGQDGGNVQCSNVEY
jgi:hypothetical protein